EWTALPDGDVYAPKVGFSEGFPAARDPASGQEWLTHCYGMVGVGRDNGPETGNGSELYVVIGQAPRRLDRNLAIAGRVLEGMPLLSGLPRGEGPMGFYDKPAKRTPIESVRLASELPAAQRPKIQVLRTDSATMRSTRFRRARSVCAASKCPCGSGHPRPRNIDNTRRITGLTTPD